MTDITSYLPDDLFAGRVVFITGGGSGINLGIGRAFARLGADVAICGRTASKLEEAAEELRGMGARVATAVADVRDPEAMDRALETSRSALGPASVLVCGAAGNFPCFTADMTANGFKSVVDIDLLGSFNSCKSALDQLRETRGSVLFISAGQAWLPYHAQAHVGAAKAGVDHLMRHIALEWGPMGIRANSVAPGPIAETEGMRRLVPEGSNVEKELNGAIPLGRYGTTDEIGAAAVFLSSPLASYITGTVLVVDGGMNLPGSGIFSAILAGGMKR